MLEVTSATRTCPQCNQAIPLEPEAPPQTRPCPHCGKTIMAAATLCGFCWTHLLPLGLDGLPIPGRTLPVHRPWWKVWG